MSTYQLNQDDHSGSRDEYMDLFSEPEVTQGTTARTQPERDDEVIAPPPGSLDKSKDKAAVRNAILTEPVTPLVPAPKRASGTAFAQPVETPQVPVRQQGQPAAQPEQPTEQPALTPQAEEKVQSVSDKPAMTQAKPKAVKTEMSGNPLTARQTAAARHIEAYSDIVKKEKSEMRRDVMLQINSAESPGTNLRRMRNLVGLSVEAVSQKTKIRLDYINQIEQDSLQLPYVYTSAYVRTIAHLYGLPAEQTEELMPLLRNLQDRKEEIASNLLENVRKNEVVDEKEEKRVQKIFIMIIIGAVIFIALVIWGIFALVNAKSTPAVRPQGVPSATGQQAEQTRPSGGLVTELQLESLIPPEIPEPSVLKRSKTPTLRP